MRVKCIPTFHPAYVLRDWAERAATVRDMRRALRESLSRDEQRPAWRFIVRPSFEQVCNTLNALLARMDSGEVLKLVHDLETRHGHIACSGIAWGPLDAICVPMAIVGNPDGYWGAEQERHIIWLHYRVLCHKNARVVNQNYLYDAQYTHRWWLFVGHFWRDTMISHHTAFCELPKKLDYQASLYCEYYKQWKISLGQEKAGG